MSQSQDIINNEAEKVDETPEKEFVEIKIDEKSNGSADEKETAKEEKEKKEKVSKEKGPSCIDNLSKSLDLAARDKRGINTEINVMFFFLKKFVVFRFLVSA